MPTRLRHLAVAGGAGQLPAQLLARTRMAVGRTQRDHLHAQARGQASGHQCGGQEQEHGDHALARTDGEGEARRDEQEVVGEEAQDRRHHRHAGARARGHQHHRHDEHHRQVGHADPAFGQPCHRTGQRGGDQRLHRLVADAAHRRQQPSRRERARACGVLMMVIS
jgi:hypothetical protein